MVKIVYYSRFAQKQEIPKFIDFVISYDWANPNHIEPTMIILTFLR